MKLKRKRVIKITFKDVKDALDTGAKVVDAVDKTIKLIDKLRK